MLWKQMYIDVNIFYNICYSSCFGIYYCLSRICCVIELSKVKVSNDIKLKRKLMNLSCCKFWGWINYILYGKLCVYISVKCTFKNCLCCLGIYKTENIILTKWQFTYWIYQYICLIVRNSLKLFYISKYCIIVL